MHFGTKKIITKIFKVIGWTLFSILMLLLLVIAAIQIPAVQEKITQKAVAFLEKKIGTRVELESLYISFPKNIVLEGLYLEDQSKDTLLYAGKLSLNTDLWALTKNEIQLNNVKLQNTTAYIKRAEGDSAFNYTYIMNAFAGDSTAVPDTLEQKGWNFSLETIGLENIKAHYYDLLTGNNLDVNMGVFELTMNKFDLQHYIFGIEEIKLENTTANLVQTKMPEVTVEVAEESTDTMTLDLNFHEIALKNVRANYTQEATGQIMRLDLGESSVQANKIDLKNKIVDLNEILLKNTFISYHQLSAKKHSNNSDKHSADKTPRNSSSSQASGVSPTGQASPIQSAHWKIVLSKLDLSGNSIQYYDFNKPHARSAVDFDHLWITNLAAEARDLVMNGSDLRGDVKDFSFSEKSGFALKSFRSAIHVSEDSAFVNDFFLETGNSKIQLEAKAQYESFSQLANNYEHAYIRLDVNPSFIGIRDVLYFNPALLDSMPLKLPSNSKINLDAAINGSVNNLAIHHLVVKAFSDTYLKTNGRIVGLPDIEKMKVNVTVDKFFTTRNDVIAILPDTLLPDSIAPPDWVNLNGEFKGNMKVAEFRTELTSSIGSVDMNGNMNLDSTSASRGFTGNLAVNEFDLGALLMQPQTIGKLDLQASVNSQGLTKEEMNSTVEANVKRFEYQGYRYENFRVNGKVKNDLFQGWASLKDPNLDFNLKGDINFQKDVPHYDFTFNLLNADFKALHLSERPLKARLTLDVDMATADMRILNGTLGIRKVAIFNGDALYAVDSLLFASIDQEGRSEIKIDSDIMKGSFEGTINVFTLPAVIREYFNTYYSLHDSVEQSYEAPQRFTFDLQLKKTDLITDIIFPQLTSFVPGEIKGDFDSKAKRLNLKFDLSQIQYSKIGIKSFLFSTNSDSARLNYNVFIDKIYVDSLRIDGLEFNGTVSHDSIRTNIIILDSLNLYKYVIGGTFFSHEKEFELKLNPNQVRLNYENWNVPENNYIRFGGKKLVAKDITLTNGKQKIIFESKEEAGSPLFIGFRELNLEYLSSMVAQKQTVTGTLHGDINIFPEKDNFQFTSDIRVTNFGIAQIEWGDLSLAVAQRTQNRFDVDFSLIGSKNDFRTKGYYLAAEKPDMNLNATIAKLDLSVLDPIASNQLKNLKGTLTGALNVSGNPKQLNIDGDITFKETKFFSNYLKSDFNIHDETISFDKKGISFDRFELVDVNNNIATLDGTVETTDYQDFTFRLNLITNQFRLLNTSAKDNDLFYGKIDINANARIRGTLEYPEVDMEVSLTDGNQFTYVVPQSEAAILEQQGIVKFVDKTFKGDPFMKKVQAELADTIKSSFVGVDLTAKIELSDKESFTIIIDPTTDDQLTVKGNTTLTLQMDRTGDMQLSGRYEISEGTYNLSFYKFVKREFSIEKGSTITWTGDPLNAAMDIRAIFKVETSPIDLLANQLQGMDRQESNKYKQRLPFFVYLNIGGQLLKPDITFKLEMPMEERNAFGGNVYAKLQDVNTRPSDLNKQVFALLILKRFVADNPFESQGSGGFEGTARTSVSKILTEQLNRLSENVRGVELSFDLKSYEDYSSGNATGQTELQLGLSKRLMNDRLVVKLSGNVDIEGQNTNQEVTDYIGDLALEYLLTDDGRFRITGFRNSNYDMIDGELTETGAGLIYIKDYNTLSELFKANAKKDKK